MCFHYLQLCCLSHLKKITSHNIITYNGASLYCLGIVILFQRCPHPRGVHLYNITATYNYGTCGDSLWSLSIIKLNITGCEGGPLPKILIESTETDTSLFGEQGKAI